MNKANAIVSIPGSGGFAAIGNQNERTETKLSRTKLYWISQAAGWLLFISVNLFIIATYESLSFPRFLMWVLLAVLGIFFTHIYRSVIKKNSWLDLPLGKIVPRVLIASLVIGILLFGIVFTVEVLTGIIPYEKVVAARLLSGTVNLSSVIFLWSLIYFAVHYMENYKKAEIESLIWEAAVKDFELKTLKSQLNPHFMFNAMNSIRALIEENPDDAKNAITRLSNLLRYSLKIERTETVPLWEEIKTVKDYLSLEEMRFEERLKYSIDVDSSAENVEVPPMMIQTLVENGIKHGISKIPEGGKLSLNADVENSTLVIMIRNNGHFSDEELKISKGFGINNTRHRLSLLYGETAAFNIKNENHNEVLAKLEIPLGGTTR